MFLIVNEFQSSVRPCVEGSPYLFKTDDFYRMVGLDIFPKGNQAGLRDGQVDEKPGKSMLHAVADTMLISAVFRALPIGWFLSHDNSISIGL